MDLPVKYSSLSWGTKRLVREEYVRLQGGLCQHCKHPLEGEPPPHIKKKRVNRKLFPPTMFDCPVHLHHDHKTGMTLGAVHSYCNAVLWQYHGE